MSSYCDLVPGDPNCIIPEIEAEPLQPCGPDNPNPFCITVTVVQPDITLDIKTLHAQYTFLVMALGFFFKYALQQWRYRLGNDNYNPFANGEFDLSDTNETKSNSWKIANRLLGYYAIFFWGGFSTTQIMTMFFGMGNKANFMIFFYGGIGGLLMLSSVVLTYMWSYEDAYKFFGVYAIYSVQIKTQAANLMADLEKDLLILFL